MSDRSSIASPLSTGVRLRRLVGSWLLVSLGVPLLLRADLGVAPFDVLNTGADAAFGISFGFWYVVDSLLFFGIGMALGARLGWASIAGTVVIGTLVNVVLRVLPETDRIAPRIALLAAGVLVIAVAVCLVITSEYGVGPTEAVMLGLMNRGMDVLPARLISDGTPLVVGALLGGAMGVGTAVFALAMGPLIRFGLRRLHYVPPHLRRSSHLAVAAD